MNQTDRELNSAAFREAAVPVWRADMGNYDAMAEDLGISRHEVMMLSMLSLLTGISSRLDWIIADMERSDP